MNMQLFLRSIFGPRLYHIFDRQFQSKQYQPNILESLPDTFLLTVQWCFGIAKWTMPFWMPFTARRIISAVFNIRVKAVVYFIYSAGIMITLMGAMIVRGLGRTLNPEYRKFLDALSKAEQRLNSESKEELALYDFEFWAWPPEFEYKKDVKQSPPKVQVPSSYRSSGNVMFDSGLNVLSSVLVSTFGVRMTYPGCTGLMNSLIRRVVQEARAKIIRDHRIERFKIITEDEEEVELFVADKRSTSPNGGVLVICCEGNAGFPEIGTTNVPLDKGFSVLGWNHPGFAGSTGLPYTHNEQQSINAIMQFANKKLGFAYENIAILAWSIGGYTASWAAMNYPNVRCVVMDATFDDIIELACKAMPNFASPLVRPAVQIGMDLNNAKQLCKYNGPVLFIRRTNDEILTTGAASELHTNRGNNILEKVLSYRYPELVTDTSKQALKEFLKARTLSQIEAFMSGLGVSEERCVSILTDYLSNMKELRFPLKVGATCNESDKTLLFIYLASKYLSNIQQTHCTPLPAEEFKFPWSEKFLMPEQTSKTKDKSSTSGESDNSWEAV